MSKKPSTSKKARRRKKAPTSAGKATTPSKPAKPRKPKAPAKEGQTRPTKASKGKERAPRKGAKEGGEKGRLSVLDAAAKVLAEKKDAMNCKDLVRAMLEKGYWSTSGKTPSSTLYAAIIREIAQKGKDARFKKVARGQFALTGKGA